MFIKFKKVLYIFIRYYRVQDNIINHMHKYKLYEPWLNKIKMNHLEVLKYYQCVLCVYNQQPSVYRNNVLKFGL